VKWSALIAALIGLAVTVGLVVTNGWAEITGAILAAGWGNVIVIALHGPQLVFSSLAWRNVVAVSRPPSPISFLGLRLIREGVNALLPVAQIGGEFVGARLLTFHGVPLAKAAAGVTVDLTVEMFTQVVFTLLGLGMLAAAHGTPNVFHWILAGALVATGVLVAFIVAQRFGMFGLFERGLLRLAQKQKWTALGAASGLNEALVELYRSPRRLILASCCHFASWLLGGLEVMAALWVVGVHASLYDSLIVESLGQAFRSFGFAVPGALGIQEGGYVLVGGLLGISPQAAIALSLLKRIREVVLGVPSLLAWQWIEGQRLTKHADLIEQVEGK
jgi:putative membrane protein